jgi:hypothetical protein
MISAITTHKDVYLTLAQRYLNGHDDAETFVRAFLAQRREDLEADDAASPPPENETNDQARLRILAEIDARGTGSGPWVDLFEEMFRATEDVVTDPALLADLRANDPSGQYIDEAEFRTRVDAIHARAALLSTPPSPVPPG